MARHSSFCDVVSCHFRTDSDALAGRDTKRTSPRRIPTHRSHSSRRHESGGVCCFDCPASSTCSPPSKVLRLHVHSRGSQDTEASSKAGTSRSSRGQPKRLPAFLLLSVTRAALMPSWPAKRRTIDRVNSRPRDACLSSYDEFSRELAQPCSTPRTMPRFKMMYRAA